MMTDKPDMMCDQGSCRWCTRRTGDPLEGDGNPEGETTPPGATGFGDGRGMDPTTSRTATPPRLIHERRGPLGFYENSGGVRDPMAVFTKAGENPVGGT